MFTITLDEIDEIFARHDHQADVIIDLYKLVFDGSAPDRPNLDQVHGFQGTRNNNNNR